MACTKAKQAAPKADYAQKYKNTDERPYFLWHLYFMDVFEGSRRF
jgi:hypothetical protein